MSLDLLRERFGHSVKKEADNKEKIHEQLNGKFNSNSMDDLKSLKYQHQEDLEEKERIIESLEIEASKLSNEVLTLEKEKSTIIEELNNSKWLESTVASKTKKLYEDKIKTMSYVDSSELIPMLIEVSRKKQGNEKLNWGNWLKIPENRYLFQINESIAKKVFEGTNVLIDRAVGFINRRRGQGGETFTTIYGLSFDGLTQHVETTFSENGATPTDRTYSFWMKATETAVNKGVFGYGSDKREAFLINHSQNAMGKPIIRLANHMYKYFMTEGHEEDGGGSSGGPADGGADEATAHIEAQDDGQWHHWMLFTDPSDASNAKLFIDGVEQDTAKFANTGTANTQQDSLTIGAVDSSSTTGEHFEGSITNFAVFSDDKTANASSHYNNGIPNKDLSGESGLVGYWKMDENGGTNVADSSGNDNDGTIANGATWITVMEVTDAYIGGIQQK